MVEEIIGEIFDLDFVCNLKIYWVWRIIVC